MTEKETNQKERMKELEKRKEFFLLYPHPSEEELKKIDDEIDELKGIKTSFKEEKLWEGYLRIGFWCLVMGFSGLISYLAIWLGNEMSLTLKIVFSIIAIGFMMFLIRLIFKHEEKNLSRAVAYNPFGVNYED